ncbi:MAG TPA: hypothetical protein VM143_07185 [Acidimicrobiales bacterium]|nr:hypothetical protein [Acidimicrobiales bacterium]
MPNLQTFPRTIVRTYLQAARLPLSAAEQVFNKTNTEDWAPTLAFESLEAEVLQFMGNALKDEELLQQGRLVRAKVAQLKKAAELEATAAAKRAEADAQYRDRVNADEAAKKRIEQQADEREAALAQEKARKKRDADGKARRQAEASRKIESAQQKQLTKQEREAAKTRIAAEQRVLAEQRKAVAAEEQVLDLDAALETTKAIRKTK